MTTPRYSLTGALRALVLAAGLTVGASALPALTPPAAAQFLQWDLTVQQNLPSPVAAAGSSYTYEVHAVNAGGAIPPASQLLPGAPAQFQGIPITVGGRLVGPFKVTDVNCNGFGSPRISEKQTDPEWSCVATSGLPAATPLPVITVTVQVPDEPGNYLVASQVDPLEVVPETDEDNNTAMGLLVVVR
jgi:hypothetical protein